MMEQFNNAKTNELRRFALLELTDGFVTEVRFLHCKNASAAAEFMNLAHAEKTEDFAQLGEDLLLCDVSSSHDRFFELGTKFDFCSNTLDVLSQRNLSYDRQRNYVRWKNSRENFGVKQYATTFEGVPVYDTIFNCSVILRSDLAKALLGSFSPEWTYQDESDAVELWAENHGASLYSAEKHEFSTESAAWLARREGKNVVVVENLS